jgi:hypothetical protein
MNQLNPHERMRLDLPLLVNEKDIAAALENSMSSRKTSETTADDDNLSHCVYEWELRMEEEEEERRRSRFECRVIQAL